jgi:hypothetical protein
MRHTSPIEKKGVPKSKIPEPTNDKSTKIWSIGPRQTKAKIRLQFRALTRKKLAKQESVDWKFQRLRPEFLGGRKKRTAQPGLVASMQRPYGRPNPPPMVLRPKLPNHPRLVLRLKPANSPPLVFRPKPPNCPSPVLRTQPANPRACLARLTNWSWRVSDLYQAWCFWLPSWLDRRHLHHPCKCVYGIRQVPRCHCLLPWLCRCRLNHQCTLALVHVPKCQPPRLVTWPPRPSVQASQPSFTATSPSTQHVPIWPSPRRRPPPLRSTPVHHKSIDMLHNTLNAEPLNTTPPTSH